MQQWVWQVRTDDGIHCCWCGSESSARTWARQFDGSWQRTWQDTSNWTYDDNSGCWQERDLDNVAAI